MRVFALRVALHLGLKWAWLWNYTWKGNLEYLPRCTEEISRPLDQVFDRVRLRVNEITKGAEVPWNAIAAKSSFMFFK